MKQHNQPKYYDRGNILTIVPFNYPLTPQKLGVLHRARSYFNNSTQLLTLYKSQVCPTIEFGSHLWSGALKYLKIQLWLYADTGGPFVKFAYLSKRIAIFGAQSSGGNAVLVLPAFQWKMLWGTSVIVCAQSRNMPNARASFVHGWHLLHKNGSLLRLVLVFNGSVVEWLAGLCVSSLLQHRSLQDPGSLLPIL